jgi:hypothetical protein
VAEQETAQRAAQLAAAQAHAAALPERLAASDAAVTTYLTSINVSRKDRLLGQSCGPTSRPASSRIPGIRFVSLICLTHVILIKRK